MVAYFEIPEAEKDSPEFSTDFDTPNLRPFFNRIVPLFESGFGTAEVKKACKLATSLALHGTASLEFMVKHKGVAGRMRMHLFMDDTDVVGVYIFSSQAVVDDISELCDIFFEELGM